MAWHRVAWQASQVSVLAMIHTCGAVKADVGQLQHLHQPLHDVCARQGAG